MRVFQIVRWAIMSGACAVGGASIANCNSDLPPVESGSAASPLLACPLNLEGGKRVQKTALGKDVLVIETDAPDPKAPEDGLKIATITLEDVPFLRIET